MFSDNFYPEMSGISDSIIDCAKELAKLGHQVDFYAAKYSSQDFAKYNVPAKELDLGENIKIHRFSSIGYPTPTKQGRLVIPTFLRWLKMKKNRPDIIHVHDCFGVCVEGMAASKFLKVPLIGTNHTPITEFMKYGPVQNKFLDKAAVNYVSWFYNRCGFVSAPCGAIFTEMKANRFKKNNKVVSNAIDLVNFYTPSPEEKAAAKKEFDLPNFTVLCSGRLGVEKHVDVVIRAVGELKESAPEVNLAITGHGAAEEGLKKLAKDLGIEDKVKFFGTVSADKLARIYRAADVFVIASTAEMQSLGLMKAMATSIPSIGVNAWALPEYINEQNGFILEPGDFKGIAEKILFLYKNPEIAKELGANGSKMVQDFAPEKIAKEWEMIYKEASANFQEDKR
jgi:glycosyltransferase involved in cell wall biosynthesis